MPMHIVDPLEAIEIEQKYSVRGTGPRRRRDSGFERLVKLAAVRQPGESVLIGEFPDAALGRVAFRDLALLPEILLYPEDEQGEDDQGADQECLVEFNGRLVNNMPFIRENV